jgi:uncharacterized protein with GYD domain
MKSIFLVNYAPQGIKGLMQGSDREAAVKSLLDGIGGKFVSLMFTRGKFDAVVIVDVPSQASNMGVAMAIRASGAFTDVVVLEELDLKAVVAEAQKAAKVYKPPG